MRYPIFEVLIPEGSYVCSPGSETRATVEAHSFENGHEVTRVRLGSQVVAIKPQSLAPGDEIGVEFEGCLVFAPSGELLATVG